MAAILEGIRPFLVAYWACAVLAALAKVASPRLDRVLRYGVRRVEGKRHTRGVVGRALEPAAFLPTRVCWPLFYVMGTFSTVCSYLLLGGATALVQAPALGLFGAHVARRLAESVAVHRYSAAGRLSPAHLVMGLSFYAMAPPTLRAARPVGLSWGMLAAFLLVQLAQASAHWTLARVKPEVGKYGVPRGALFSAACPHYAAELATYCVLAYHARSSAAFLLLAFTALNLVPSAAQTLAWYVETFGARAPRYALLKHVF